MAGRRKANLTSRNCEPSVEMLRSQIWALVEADSPETWLAFCRYAFRPAATDEGENSGADRSDVESSNWWRVLRPGQRDMLRRTARQFLVDSSSTKLGTSGFNRAVLLALGVLERDLENDEGLRGVAVSKWSEVPFGPSVDLGLVAGRVAARIHRLSSNVAPVVCWSAWKAVIVPPSSASIFGASPLAGTGNSPRRSKVLWQIERFGPRCFEGYSLSCRDRTGQQPLRSLNVSAPAATPRALS